MLCYKTKNPVGLRLFLNANVSGSLIIDATKTSLGKEYDDVICTILWLVIYWVGNVCHPLYNWFLELQV